MECTVVPAVCMACCQMGVTGHWEASAYVLRIPVRTKKKGFAAEVVHKPSGLLLAAGAAGEDVK
jgi:hypothetical protein